jgi:hypothetical protein
MKKTQKDSKQARPVRDQLQKTIRVQISFEALCIAYNALKEDPYYDDELLTISRMTIFRGLRSIHGDDAEKFLNFVGKKENYKK